MGKGLIHIYTGDGKGKTTAAIGLATRALGCGLQVCYVSFHKKPEQYGYTEMDSLRKLGATVINKVKSHSMTDCTLDSIINSHEAEEAVEDILSLVKCVKYDLLIMDEILISLRDKYITEVQLINFISSKPENLELVLTGRGATEKIIELADYVSFIEKIKHPFDKGVLSRKGIEY